METKNITIGTSVHSHSISPSWFSITYNTKVPVLEKGMDVSVLKNGEILFYGYVELSTAYFLRLRSFYVLSENRVISRVEKAQVSNGN